MCKYSGVKSDNRYLSDRDITILQQRRCRFWQTRMAFSSTILYISVQKARETAQCPHIVNQAETHEIDMKFIRLLPLQPVFFSWNFTISRDCIRWSMYFYNMACYDLKEDIINLVIINRIFQSPYAYRLRSNAYQSLFLRTWDAWMLLFQQSSWRESRYASWGENFKIASLQA